MLKVVLSIILCVIAQSSAGTVRRANVSIESSSVGLEAIGCANSSLESVANDNVFPPIKIEAIIDAYLPVEYVDPIDDSQSFGELTISEHNPNSPSQESVVSDLVERCKALLKTIKEYIVSKVRGVINTINNVEVHAKVIIDSGASSFKRKLDEIIKKGKDGIKKKIAELKKDAGECLKESEQQFKVMVKDFILNETHCVTDEFRKAFCIVKNTKNTILAAIQRIETIPGEITTCLKGNNKFSCIKSDVWDVLKVEEQQFKNFVFQFTSAASFITGFETRVAACALDHLGRAGQASLDVVEKFPKCVLNKVIK